MSVHVEISSALRRYLPGYDGQKGLDLETAGQSVAQLIDRLGIPAKEVHLIMVNRKASKPGQVLCDGDLVGLFPVVDGG